MQTVPWKDQDLRGVTVEMAIEEMEPLALAAFFRG